MNLWHGIGVVLRPLKKLAFFLLSKIHRTTRPRVAIVVGNEVLLVQNWGDRAWALPGGGAHRHEDLAHAAQREIKEELGVSLDSDRLKYIKTFTFKYFDAPLYIANLTKKPVIHRQKIEITSYSWWPLKKTAQSAAIHRDTAFLIEVIVRHEGVKDGLYKA